MHVCPNCSEELVNKKYRNKKRLKCTSCGYETSEWEIEQESIEFQKRLIQQRRYKIED